MSEEKHEVFIGYYHRDDQGYRESFERLFGHLFTNKSVALGEIDPDLSAEYIKRLIQEGSIFDSSVVLVLVGPKTYCRKHVNWEISAGLNKKVGGHFEPVGICLPTHSDFSRNQYSADKVPARLVANLESGVAHFYKWTENAEGMSVSMHS